MLYSECLEGQHLALARSPDLRDWTLLGPVDISIQPWLAHRHGAPSVWWDGDRYLMLLMGKENADNRSSLGMLYSHDGIRWTILPEQ